MAGYIGQYAKRRKRNFLLFISIVLIIALFYYLIPLIKLEEIQLSDSLLTKESEIIQPILDSNIDELKIEIFDKKQKIIFRDREISKLKKENQKLINDNEILKKTIIKLNKEISIFSNTAEKINSINSEVVIIKKENEKEKKNLENIIKNITSDKVELSQLLEKIEYENNLLQKDYQNLISKNLALEELKIEFQNKIYELENFIEEQKKIITNLEDITHHN